MRFRPTGIAWSAACLAALLALRSTKTVADEPPARHRFDVVVYGGTSAAVVAAVQARRMGKSAAIVCPDQHLGGLSSGGLGWTDTGDKSVIGGLAREFYHRVWQHYQSPAAWRWQSRGEYGNRGQGTEAIDGEARTMWIFEPHVAEQVFEDLVPVCVSSSHIAYGSIRMEPVFMILGQSAATVAVMAIDARCAVQDVPYQALSARLRQDRQVLEVSP